MKLSISWARYCKMHLDRSLNESANVTEKLWFQERETGHDQVGSTRIPTQLPGLILATSPATEDAKWTRRRQRSFLKPPLPPIEARKAAAKNDLDWRDFTRFLLRYQLGFAPHDVLFKIQLTTVTEAAGLSPIELPKFHDCWSPIDHRHRWIQRGLKFLYQPSRSP